MGVWQAIVVAATVCGASPDGMILQFSASWCGPCREMSPIVAQLEREGLPIRKVDIERERELAQHYGVQGVPTFILVVGGKEVSRVVGKTSEANLRSMAAKIPARPAAAEVMTTAARPGARRRMPTAVPAADLGQAAAPVTAPPTQTAAGNPSTFAAAPASQGGNTTETEPRTADLEISPALAEPAPKKSKFRLPFARETAAVPAAPVVARGKSYAAEPVMGAEANGPLAASARIRITDKKGENFGSGTVIDSRVGRTLVVTCGHIFRNVDDSSRIEVDLFHTGVAETHVGKVVSYDMEADVGLISIPTEGLPSVPVAAAEYKLLKGAPVSSVGCGGGEKPSVHQMRITALNKYLGPDNLECDDVPVQGRSGGGLFTRDGQLIGVCSAVDPTAKRGLYCGLKPIHALLERCRTAERGMAATSRGAGGERPVIGAGEGEGGEAAEIDLGAESLVELGNDSLQTDLDALPALAAAQEASVRQGSTGRKTAEHALGKGRGSVLPAHLPSSELAPETRELVDEALAGVGPAEVVCVIRPIDQPRAASRVVVINRASPQFVSYLTEELAEQDAITPTTLEHRSGSKRAADVSRPVSAGDADNPEGTNQTAPAVNRAVAESDSEHDSDRDGVPGQRGGNRGSRSASARRVRRAPSPGETDPGSAAGGDAVGRPAAGIEPYRRKGN